MEVEILNDIGERVLWYSCIGYDMDLCHGKSLRQRTDFFKEEVRECVGTARYGCFIPLASTFEHIQTETWNGTPSTKRSVAHKAILLVLVSR